METGQGNRKPVNPIPPPLQNLFADLTFLSQIKRGLKPCCSTKVLSKPDWVGTIYRSYKFVTSGECKEKVVSDVEAIINTAAEIIGNEKYNEHLGMTIGYLDKARPGIESLKYTYENFPSIISRIEVVLANIDIQLNRYPQFIKKGSTQEPSDRGANDNEGGNKGESKTGNNESKTGNNENKTVGNETKTIEEEIGKWGKEDGKNPYQPEIPSPASPITPLVLSDSMESAPTLEKRRFKYKGVSEKNKKAVE